MLILLLLPLSTLAQTELNRPHFRVMEWNVENLFDTRHDSLKNDYEFLPEGTRKWTKGRYWHKLDEISRTIVALGDEGRLPVLIGLCEVENDSVLFDLTRRSPLRNVSYGYVMTDSPDERGVDVALLYKKGLFRLLGSESKRIPSVAHGFKPTRDILHAWGHTITDDTIHVLVCHLPSRAGGLASSDHHRSLAAQTLKHVIDSLLTSVPDCKLVVMGDFNATPRDEIFQKVIQPLPFPTPSTLTSHPSPLTSQPSPLTSQPSPLTSHPSPLTSHPSPLNPQPSTLYTLMPTSKKELRREWGTYRYQGLWSFIDHILVSSSLLPLPSSDPSSSDPSSSDPSSSDPSSPNSLSKSPIRIVNFEWLLEDNKTYGGKNPYRTYGGTYYKGGISDHLPIYVDLW